MRKPLNSFRTESRRWNHLSENRHFHAGFKYLTCVQGVAGKLTEPMRWQVKGNIITEVDGGGEVGEECKRLFKEVPESNRLIEIMFGYHPKASAQHGIDDPMPWELISKMPWAGL